MSRVKQADRNKSRDQADLFVPMPATLCHSRMLTPSEKLLTLKLEGGQTLVQEPGQFVQVSVFGLEEAPISVCSAAESHSTFELCIRRVGKLTAALHCLETGEHVGIRGPFGHGFPLTKLFKKDIVLVVGGIGMAPVRSLIQHCLAHREQFGRLTLLYGAKRPAELLFRDEFDSWVGADNFELHLTVDAPEDQWTGSVGLITDLVDPLKLRTGNTIAVVVGPPVMYRPVISKLKAKGLDSDDIVVSLERNMRCGVGKCGHCMIENAYYCCLDGPVFMLSALTGLNEGI